MAVKLVVFIVVDVDCRDAGGNGACVIGVACRRLSWCRLLLS